MKIYADNKQARFNYDIQETLEAGLVLAGHEVKSIKTGRVSIKGSFVRVLGNEAWLVGATVPPYQPGNTPADYDGGRSRKLLLNKKELQYLTGKSQENGLTLVPVKLYNKKGFIKLEVGIGRGRKKADKREVIRKRESGRQIERALRK